MIEPEAGTPMIEPEAAPAPPRRRRQRAVLAGVTALAVVAGGIAVANGGAPEPKPLALMAGGVAGDSAGGRAETMMAPAPAIAPADSRSSYPYGGWGLTFQVAGTLPDLPDHAPAWRATGPTLDRAAATRIAGALGLPGTPAPRDGGWFVDGRDWTLNAFPGGDTWSLNLFRGRYAGQGDDLVADDPPAGPTLSPAEAERRVRELLDRMGAPAGSWKFETTDTEMGIGWACAAPAPPMSPEELRKLEAEKLRQLEQPNSATTPAMPAPEPGRIPADKPAPDGSVGSCPPPPAPVKGFTVALYPLLDGHRADWPVWQVTLRSDGRVESLYGSWVTFERGEDYRLRGVSAALKDLQSPPPSPLRRPVGTATDPGQTFDAPAIAVDTPAGSGAGTTGSAGRLPLKGDMASGRAIEPAPACPPVAMPMPMPMAAEQDKAPSSPAPWCGPPAPQVVTITGVELGLLQVPVFEDGRARLHLVPAYRFMGRFDNGSWWETSVIALHPDAIAPPPDFPVVDDVRPGGGGGTTGIGKAVPPMPPGAEPAVVIDPDTGR